LLIMGVSFCDQNVMSAWIVLEALSCTNLGTVRMYKNPFMISLMIINASMLRGNLFSINRYVSRSTKRNPAIFFPKPSMYYDFLLRLPLRLHQTRPLKNFHLRLRFHLLCCRSGCYINGLVHPQRSEFPLDEPEIGYVMKGNIFETWLVWNGRGGG
jgi:hypothetical protein